MFCHKCGTQVEGGAQFCAKCGTAVATSGEAPGRATDEEPKPKTRRSLKLVGWLLVVVAVASVFAPVPKEVALILAFLLSWAGWSMVFPGTSLIKKAGAGFVGAIVLTLLMDYVGGMVSSNGGKPDADAIKIPIDALVQDYKTNEVGADQKYKGRVVETEGSVVEIKQDIANNPYVIVGGPVAGVGALFGKSTSEGLQCSLSAAGARQAAKLKPGDSVAIQGRVVGLMIYVQATECLFVERPQSKPAASAAPTSGAPVQTAPAPSAAPQATEKPKWVEADCEITTKGETIRPPCEAIHYEGGAVSIQGPNENTLFSDDFGKVSLIDVVMDEGGSARVTTMRTDGMKWAWGEAKVDAADASCWVGSDFRVCARPKK